MIHELWYKDANSRRTHLDPLILVKTVWVKFLLFCLLPKPTNSHHRHHVFIHVCKRRVPRASSQRDARVVADALMLSAE